MVGGAEVGCVGCCWWVSLESQVLFSILTGVSYPDYMFALFEVLDRALIDIVLLKKIGNV